MNKYVSKKRALEILGVSPVTLIKMGESGEIEMMKTPGGHRRYNLTEYIKNNDIVVEEPEVPIVRRNICYIRVSTAAQKDDLERQREYMVSRYPDYKVIEDVGSGVNFNRRGLRKIIKMAIAGEINQVVVAYKDRLARFGFELIEDLINEYSGGTVLVENDSEYKEPKEELVEDVLQILNVYVAKMNGLRKYGKA